MRRWEEGLGCVGHWREVLRLLAAEAAAMSARQAFTAAGPLRNVQPTVDAGAHIIACTASPTPACPPDPSSCSYAAIISLLTSTASLQRFAVICFVVTYFVIANALMVRRYLPGRTRLRCSRRVAWEVSNKTAVHWCHAAHCALHTVPRPAIL